MQIARLVPMAVAWVVACGAPPDPQNPPAGAAALGAWLSAGVYKQWKCEPEAHDGRSPSPHGKNRVCSNARLSAAGAGEYPVDAASVKELFAADGVTVSGYGVARHVKSGSTGDTWYWYERTASGVVADGTGEAGSPKTVCVACHAGAGSDAMHSGHDFVYTQVQ